MGGSVESNKEESWQDETVQFAMSDYAMINRSEA